MASSTRAPRGVTLVCHRDTPCDAVFAVTARVSRDASGTLSAHYVIDADVASLNVPAAGPPHLGRDLWRHTCCEMFISRGGPGYHELNFAPSGAWSAYAFDAYRYGGRLDADALDPPPVTSVAVRSDSVRIDIEVSIRLERLSDRLAGDR